MSSINLLVSGDFCPQGKVSEIITSRKYEEFEGELCEEIKRADFSVVNLEAPIIGANVPNPILKHGPNLKAPDNTLTALKYMGFDMVTLANNHILDYGEEGLNNTIYQLNKSSLKFVGAGKSLDEAKKTIYVEVKGKRLAFINCCEHEYSIASENGAGANPLNPIQQYYAIIEAKSKADFVIVIVHGGIENYQLPSLRMKETYRFFIDAGADVVINHHQHCYSGYETYKGKLIFYGLGNFCFDWPNMLPSWYEGIIPVITLDTELSFRVIPYCQCKGDVIRVMNSEEQKSFKYRLDELNAIIEDNQKLKSFHTELMDGTMENYEFILSPYSISYTIRLFKKKLLPSFFRKRKWLWLQSAIQCESHYERFLYMVNKKVKQ